MRHLVKLEFRKNSFRGVLWTAGIAVLAILGFTLLLASDAEGLGSYEEAITVMGMLVRVTFVVHASVLLSRLIVDEYRNRTITVLFTYPINRKKLLLAKLLLVGAMTFGLVIVCDLLVVAGFYLFNEKIQYFPELPAADVWRKQAILLVVNAAACAGMSLIPLFFGMIKKSVPTTIVSSILIVALLNSSNNGETLGSNVSVSIAFGVIGVLVALLAIRNVERADL